MKVYGFEAGTYDVYYEWGEWPAVRVEDLRVAFNNNHAWTPDEINTVADAFRDADRSGRS